ncbi:unnamed protein product [Blumeria hordei]|uniref:Uncharacterized protein n=1 Tax=Blumeria hordei TaxID=2867405 RepID=A0A383UXJ5_BLUHO|nr:unnamed protein product [Blumeria hordei]
MPEPDQHSLIVWDGSSEFYPYCTVIWREAMEEPKIMDEFGGEEAMCRALIRAIPIGRRDRIGPTFMKQLSANNFNAVALLDELDRKFIIHEEQDAFFRPFEVPEDQLRRIVKRN